VGFQVRTLSFREASDYQLTGRLNHSSRKYYYVQISTGKSTWETPTTAAPGVVTGSNSSTPAQGTPYTPPPPGAMSSHNNTEPGHEGSGTRGFNDNAQHGESTDRAGGLGVSLLSIYWIGLVATHVENKHNADDFLRRVWP
jgi:hypothetical protein